MFSTQVFDTMGILNYEPEMCELHMDLLRCGTHGQTSNYNGKLYIRGFSASRTQTN